MKKPAPRSAALRHMRHSGFTLIEVLVSIVIVSVLLALAAPSFLGSIQRNRVDAAKDELLSSIQVARMEAVRQGRTVIIARRTGCVVTLSTDNDWSCGWQSFVDLDEDGAQDANEPTTQSVDLSTDVKLLKNNVSPLTRISFSRQGLVQPFGQSFEIYPTGATVSKGVKLCMSSGSRFKTIKGADTC